MYVRHINVLWRRCWVYFLSFIQVIFSFSLIICRVMPAFLADLFGTHNIGVCFGILITAWSIAGTGGGLLFTAIYNHHIVSLGYTTKDAYPFIVNSYWILSLVAVGLLCAILIRTDLKDRVLPPVEGEWFRFRLFRRMLIFKRISACPELEIMSSDEYDQLWEN